MNDDFTLSTLEPLVPAWAPISDWSRVPPATRRPAPPAPRLGAKKKPAERKPLRYYQQVARGLA